MLLSGPVPDQPGRLASAAAAWPLRAFNCFTAPVERRLAAGYSRQGQAFFNLTAELLKHRKAAQRPASLDAGRSRNFRSPSTVHGQGLGEWMLAPLY
jgi:hypothetical protein